MSRYLSNLKNSPVNFENKKKATSSLVGMRFEGEADDKAYKVSGAKQLTNQIKRVAR
jgi:hypothetical protein